MDVSGVPTERGVNKTTLHPESLVRFTPEDVLVMRKQYEPVAAQQDLQYDGVIQDRVIQHGTDEIPLRVYRPKGLPDDPVIVVSFHGGGMVLGSYNHTISQQKVISRVCQCIIVDVEYRLCPEYNVLVGLGDCKVATQWVQENRTSIGGSKCSAVGVYGDSAGGICVAYVTKNVTGLKFQILTYPWLDMTNSLPSRTELDGPSVPLALLKWLASNVLYDIEDERDPRWSPVFTLPDDLVSVPPALIILAQIDPCIDDGKVYAGKLVDAGVYIDVLEIKDAKHGFLSTPEHNHSFHQQVYRKMASFLQWIHQDL